MSDGSDLDRYRLEVLSRGEPVGWRNPICGTAEKCDAEVAKCHIYEWATGQRWVPNNPWGRA